MSERTAAQRLLEEGSARSEAGDTAGAERAYLAAVGLEPAWSVPLYNLGLLYKYQGRWEESLEFNRRASELAADDQAAWWNRGTAATALGRWPEARLSWVKCGIADPGGTDPPDYQLGQNALRLHYDGAGEVVWGDRLDPPRARPQHSAASSAYRQRYRPSGRRSRGHRVVKGVECPVFNVLQRLVPSIQTFVVELASVDDAAVKALEDIAIDMGGAAENWGTSPGFCAGSAASASRTSTTRSKATALHTAAWLRRVPNWPASWIDGWRRTAAPIWSRGTRSSNVNSSA